MFLPLKLIAPEATNACAWLDSFDAISTPAQKSAATSILSIVASRLLRFRINEFIAPEADKAAFLMPEGIQDQQLESYSRWCGSAQRIAKPPFACPKSVQEQPDKSELQLMNLTSTQSQRGCASKPRVARNELPWGHQVNRRRTMETSRAPSCCFQNEFSLREFTCFILSISAEATFSCDGIASSPSNLNV